MAHVFVWELADVQLPYQLLFATDHVRLIRVSRDSPENQENQEAQIRPEVRAVPADQEVLEIMGAIRPEDRVDPEGPEDRVDPDGPEARADPEDPEARADREILTALLDQTVLTALLDLQHQPPRQDTTMNV
jgi:hypothetical protein